ncbi:MAG: septation protein SepH [Bifidobacteriaceae bacterium]|jgi:hypothetical protein|nr:septation protein SepH [Bifidobacteriaceae bacterium]MCI1914259.1 septation protein SepH [Bifidobacteriaceae bacterium]
MKKAVFDHVDDEGNLILDVDTEKVTLDVTDALERGILSSKQIKSEQDTATAPVEPSALPISSIQTLVREGHTDDEIARKYSIDASLVRRFAQPVETEKRYAIAQFLAVNTQTGAATRKLEDVISHNLSESGVDPEDVSWEATRQGRNPWKIVAHFNRRDQEYKGTWMWNLRDNSVVSIDPVAKRLLGENASAGTLLFGEEPVVNTSSRAIQAALNGRGPIPPAWLNDDGDAAGATSPAPQSDPRTASVPANEANAAEESSETESNTPESNAAPVPTPPTKPVVPDSAAAQPAEGAPDANGDHSKKHRAAVPSWDDILFGD